MNKEGNLEPKLGHKGQLLLGLPGAMSGHQPPMRGLCIRFPAPTAFLPQTSLPSCGPASPSPQESHYKLQETFKATEKQFSYLKVVRDHCRGNTNSNAILDFTNVTFQNHTHTGPVTHKCMWDAWVRVQGLRERRASPNWNSAPNSLQGPGTQAELGVHLNRDQRGQQEARVATFVHRLLSPQSGFSVTTQQAPQGPSLPDENTAK